MTSGPEGIEERAHLSGRMLGRLRVVDSPFRHRWTFVALATMAISCLLAPAVAAQETNRPETGRIAGRVVDVAIGRGVGAVDVVLPALGLATATDASGRFALEGVPAGGHTLRVRHLSYGETEVEAEVVAGLITALTIRLQPRPVELEPLEVEVESELRVRSLDRQGFYDRWERAAGGEFFGPEYLVRWPGLRVPELVGRVGGARLQRFADGTQRLVFNRYKRGTRPCPASFYVDGALWGTDAPPFPITEVAAVEVYKSRAEMAGTGDAYFIGKGGACGMVLVWTWRGPNPFHRIDRGADPEPGRALAGREVRLCQAGGGAGRVTIEGRVTDALTEVVLPGASVTALVETSDAMGEPERYDMVTDGAGRYRFCDLPAEVTLTLEARLGGTTGVPVRLRPGPAPGVVARDLALEVGPPR